MLVSVNGARTPPAEATLSLFDRGFLFGDAIYEVVCAHGNRPLQLSEHLDRLEQSGRAVDLDVGALRARLEREVRELVAASPRSELLYVRIMITRGTSPDLELVTVEGPPQWFVMAKPLPPWEPRLFQEGIRLLSVGSESVVGRVAPRVKSNNRQANLMAHRHARARGCDDALFVDPRGNVTEGPTWNIFAVRGGAVATPPLEGGLLPGITRRTVLELCAQLDLPTAERDIALEEARGADELFITSTTRGLMPVARLDEVAPGAPVPGPVSSRLRAALDEHIRRACGLLPTG